VREGRFRALDELRQETVKKLREQQKPTAAGTES